MKRQLVLLSFLTIVTATRADDYHRQAQKLLETANRQMTQSARGLTGDALTMTLLQSQANANAAQANKNAADKSEERRASSAVTVPKMSSLPADTKTPAYADPKVTGSNESVPNLINQIDQTGTQAINKLSNDTSEDATVTESINVINASTKTLVGGYQSAQKMVLENRTPEKSTPSKETSVRQKLQSYFSSKESDAAAPAADSSPSAAPSHDMSTHLGNHSTEESSQIDDSPPPSSVGDAGLTTQVIADKTTPSARLLKAAAKNSRR